LAFERHCRGLQIKVLVSDKGAISKTQKKEVRQAIDLEDKATKTGKKYQTVRRPLKKGGRSLTLDFANKLLI
jgi:hypothetical protein